MHVSIYIGGLGLRQIFRFGGNPSHIARPLLYYTAQEKLVIQYARRHFTGYQALPRSKDIPPITEAQAEALDALHFTAERYNLGLNFQRGDIQYINNLSIFHARDGFKDSDTKKYVLYPLRTLCPTPGPISSTIANSANNLYQAASVTTLVKERGACLGNPRGVEAFVE